nr:hypothetical protein GCM10020093_059870 [Planobispora longispora]
MGRRGPGLMLQALHPLAMRGVWQNSNFQEDPFGRLRRTADFVGRVTFGSPDEADEIGRRVRSIHRSLRINDPDTGGTHRVDDPELLLWVHCAEVSSYLAVARRAGLGLTDRQADRYLAEQRRSATYVGLHAEDVPGSLAEMDDYFARARPRLKVTPRPPRPSASCSGPASPPSCACSTRASRPTSRSARCATSRCPAGPGRCTACCPRCRPAR